MLKCDSDKCVNTPEKEMRPDINEASSCDHALASVQLCILSLKIIISVKNDLKKPVPSCSIFEQIKHVPECHKKHACIFCDIIPGFAVIYILLVRKCRTY